jgi:hypothetical protein
MPATAMQNLRWRRCQRTDCAFGDLIFQHRMQVFTCMARMVYGLPDVRDGRDGGCDAGLRM